MSEERRYVVETNANGNEKLLCVLEIGGIWNYFSCWFVAEPVDLNYNVTLHLKVVSGMHATGY